MKGVVESRGRYYPIPDSSSLRFDLIESETGSKAVGIFLKIDGEDQGCIGIMTKKQGIRQIISELEKLLVEVDE